MKTRALRLSLLLVLIVVWVLSSGGVVSEEVMPYGDSAHYVLRGMTLYGYLHTGQWGKFWDLFTLPKQSLAPLHYWIFFLLPQAWASITSYGIIQGLTTYGLLALGAWALCRALDRVEWAAPLFLLCASQNISLDYSYYYFADVPFLALGTVALAWQVRAWRDVTWTNSLISGLGASLMFWVKAPNALLFAGTYFLAEIVRVVVAWRKIGPEAGPKEAFRKGLFRHASAVAVGFVPMTVVTLACGGFQSIMRLIDANEVSGLFVTNLDCTGILRLFYFPLCLSFFYNVSLWFWISVVVIAVTVKLNRDKKASTVAEPPMAAFSAGLLVPLIIAYAALGEFFSFGMQNKEMRGMLMVLPVFWLAIFWVLERWRVRPGVLFLAVAVYVANGHSQALLDAFGTKEVNPQSYQLEGDWLSRFPQAHNINSGGITFTQSLLTMIERALPEGGKVAVGTEQLYLTSESLVWIMQHNQALRGEDARYEFDNFLTFRGEYCREQLLGARCILVFVHPALQYSRPVQITSMALVGYVDDQWVNKDHSARIVAIQSKNGEPLGYLIVMNEPLQDAQITSLIQSTHGSEFAQGMSDNMLNDRRLSWSECRDLLMRWKQKRLGN